MGAGNAGRRARQLGRGAGRRGAPDDFEEPAEAAVDMEQLLEAVQLPMARPTAPQAFTGRFYRLDAQ